MRTLVSMRGGAWRALLRTGISSVMMRSSDLAGLEQAPDSIPESPLGLSIPRGNCLYGQTPKRRGELLGLSSSSDDFRGDGVNGNDDEDEEEEVASSILNASSFSEWSVFKVRRSGIFFSSSDSKYGGMIVWSAERKCDWRRETSSTFRSPGLSGAITTRAQNTPICSSDSPNELNCSENLNMESSKNRAF